MSSVYQTRYQHPKNINMIFQLPTSISLINNQIVNFTVYRLINDMTKSFLLPDHIIATVPVSVLYRVRKLTIAYININHYGHIVAVQSSLIEAFSWP